MSLKMTLLDMVQDIMSDMSSDAVNSISDTAESLQVAQIIKSTYAFMLSQRDRPWLGTLFTLDSAVSATPTKMLIPDTIQEVLWIKYNCIDSGDTDKEYKDIIYKTPEEFASMTYLRNSSDSTIDIVTENSVALLIRNDVEPTYWTSFDDEYIYFDSYDSAVEANLQGSKTACHGYKEPTWSMTDTFTPDLPSAMFPFLLAEAKTICMTRLKQTNDPTSAKQARDGRTRSQASQWRQNRNQSGDRPDFGRK
jgi:hypothetical protein